MRLSLLVGAAFAFVLTTSCSATVKTSRADHPYYLHALSDLRAARWMIEHRPGDAAVSSHEDEAINEIDRTIAELKAAAIDDGKNIRDHANVDDHTNYAGRLRSAVGLLRSALEDTNREEDDPEARGLRQRAVGHIVAALHATDLAIQDIERSR